VAADVCRVLELTNPTEALRALDDDEKITISNSDGHSGQRGGAQFLNVVSEPGLYSLILRSRKPRAKDFKRWLTHDVIPSIRKHGGYLTPAKAEEVLLNPDTIIKLAMELKAARERASDLSDTVGMLDGKIKADRPKVDFYDSYAFSKTDIEVSEMALFLFQAGYKIGRNRLFRDLREQGWLVKAGYRYNLPTKRALTAGYFKQRVSATGKVYPTLFASAPSVRIVAIITPKGQQHFFNHYLNKRPAVIQGIIPRG
jgi:anti-repressor protein